VIDEPDARFTPGLTMSGVGESYLLARFALVRDRVRLAVARRQSADPEPDDRFRGLYITDDQALHLLDDRATMVTDDPSLTDERAALERWADGQQADGVAIRLRSTEASFGLTALDVDMLLVALGPDLDPRLEQAYGYLHDDVTRRRASIGLALELCGLRPHDATGRHRFEPDAPLVTGGLVEVEEHDRPYLTRPLRVPDPVTRYLLGDDGPDPTVAPFVTEAVASPTVDGAPLAGALGQGRSLVYVRDRVGAAALSFVARGATDHGVGFVALDLASLATDDDIRALARAAGRHARLRGAVLVVAGLDNLAERGSHAVRAFTDLPGPVVVVGTPTWDPLWAADPPLVLDAPEITGSLIDGLPFRLTPEQADRARIAAHLQAESEGTDVELHHLAAGARSQNAGGLERLALRVPPEAGWSDLVVPDDVSEQLMEVVHRVRHRHQVLDVWGVRRGAAKGKGVTALFAGDSGTGKTLAAEVLAGALDLDLYVIDLATVVDKYIGETEKNLDRIFREADRVNGVLLFDEADAIFGKRSEVQDARDRYANVEVAYLLQRMERFDGIAILTTNLRANIDEAFLRRLDALVDFPLPDEELRRMIWERHLPEALPRADNVDLAFLAQAFDLSGGNIKNIAVSSAFLAASGDGVLTMESLVRATGREYRKLGRLCVATEFGPYFHLVQ
jgi:SpoVK/Ycf46/Vps4 family AAA+-type ATPase